MAESKVCRSCQQEKQLTEFHKVGGKQSHIYRTYCNTCSLEMGKKFKDYKKSWRLKNRYNLDRKVYDQMLVDCNDSCMICGIHSDKLTKSLCVDHNHNTGKVRGLLCGACNSLIGYAYENKEVLYKAIEYLDRYEGNNFKLVS